MDTLGAISDRIAELTWWHLLILVCATRLLSRLNLSALQQVVVVLVIPIPVSTSGGSAETRPVLSGAIVPFTDCKLPNETAPLVIISSESVTLNGEDIGDPRTIKDDPSDDIPLLTERLAALSSEEEASFEPTPGEPTRRGLIILQADRATPSEVVNKVTTIMYRTRWPNISFGVDERIR